MSVIHLELATKLDGSETHMLAVLVDSWGDKLVIPLNCEMVIEPADYFMPCAHCGNAVLECNFEAGSDCCDRCTAGHKSDFVPTTMFQNHIGKRVRIPEDRTEDIINMMDACVHTHIETCPMGVCGISDICTKRDELIGVIPKMAEVKNLKEVKMEITGKSMEDRIKAAVQEASDAFWEVIAKKHFPDAVDGAFLMSDMDDIMLSWVTHWVENNVPTANWKDKEATPEEWTEDMGLHYPGVWHMHHTGGGCMVVTSDNVVVAGEHRYMGITSECVVIYTDTFAEDSFLNVFEESNCWSFGDNPTVLMNIIDEAFGGNCLWNTGHLFDDIMTIAKSGKC